MKGAKSLNCSHLLLICGILQIGGWAFLTFYVSPGFAYEVENDLMPTWNFFAIQGILWLILAGTFLLIRKEGFVKQATGIVLVVAVCLRLIAIPGEPIHESDFYRYLWDGKVAKARVNPYLFEPGALYLDEKNIDFEFEDETTGVTWRGRNFSDDEKRHLTKLRELRDGNPVLFERVSHPAVTTIYPPAAQWVFWFSQACFGDSIIGMKFIFALFDIGAVVLILLILKGLGRPTSWAILYGWNPLPIKEFANSAHYDAVAIFFMLLAVWLALLKWPPIRKVVWVAVALALGTLSKYFAILLLPVLLVYLHEESYPGKSRLWNRILSLAGSHLIWIGLVTFFIVVGIGFVPYLIWNDAGGTEVFSGLSTYQKHWQYSPGLFALIERGIGLLTDHSFVPAKTTAAFLLSGSVVVIALISRRELLWKCFAVVASLFVMSPTAFPWYFCWVLAFVPFQNRLSWLVLGLLLPLNYLDFHSAGDIPLANVRWGGFYATQILLWGIFLITWIGESVRRHFV